MDNGSDVWACASTGRLAQHGYPTLYGPYKQRGEVWGNRTLRGSPRWPYLPPTGSHGAGEATAAGAHPARGTRFATQPPMRAAGPACVGSAVRPPYSSSAMGVYEQIAGLPLEIESYELEGLE